MIETALPRQVIGTPRVESPKTSEVKGNKLTLREKGEALLDRVRSWLPFWKKQAETAPQEVIKEIAHLDTDLAAKPDSKSKAKSDEEDPSTKEVSAVKRPAYIQETTDRVEEQSAEALEKFVDSDQLRMQVKISLSASVSVEVLIDKYPNNADEIRASANNPQALQRLIANFYPMGGDVLYQEVNQRLELKARQLITESRQKGEDFKGEGSVLIISCKPEDVMKVVNEGRYVPALDRRNHGYDSFTDFERQKIDEALTMQPGSDGYDFRFKGLSPLAKRYIREVELGTYPVNG